MRVVCAWCGAVLVEGEGQVSHGICGACSELFERAYLRALRERARRQRRGARPRAGAPLPGFEAALAGRGACPGRGITSAGVR
ncbi:MAG: hypothetical protein KatS3mg064_1417 [Tepidiforma sp.]|nr:hypothetical protein [Tepidiforma sp.]GIW18260.1 MAG: hypothetical protein KatS3mg064_1417 [Tepidiforma sp.]